MHLDELFKGNLEKIQTYMRDKGQEMSELRKEGRKEGRYYIEGKKKVSAEEKDGSKK